MSRYFAPAFQIEVDGSRLKADVSKNIQHLQVVSAPDQIDRFSFTLANALPTMRWTHGLDAELFRPGSHVKVSMGYADEPTHEMMYGEITHMNPTFPAGSMPTLGIEGHSLLHRMSGESKTRTFQNTDAKQIASQIGQDAGLQVQADDIPLQFDYVIQPNQSDLSFLKNLAKSLHCEILVQNKTLIFRRIAEDETSVLTFVWFGPQESFASSPDTFPLKSFSPEMNTMEPVSAVQYRGWDPTAKKALVSNASSSGQKSLMCGSDDAAQFLQHALNRPRNVVHVTRPFGTQDEGDLLAQSSYNAKALGFIGGTAETIGIPQLWSGRRVKLRGLGKVFSGCYYVQQATHTIDESGYSTSFTVKRDATNDN